MTYLLDTDICIYWLKRSQPILERVKTAGQNEIAVSAITVAELYFGAYNSARVTENLERAARFLEQISILPLTDSVLRKFGQVKSDLRKHGQLLPDFDLLIASTALAEGLVLVTNNVQHYARIAELRLENWLTS